MAKSDLKPSRVAEPVLGCKSPGKAGENRHAGELQGCTLSFVDQKGVGVSF